MPKNKQEITNEIVMAVSDDPSVGTLSISGVIGWDFWGDAWSYGAFQAKLEDMKDVDVIKMTIHSPGGNLGDTIAMYNALVKHPARVEVVVDGVAASAASMLVMAGDKVIMPENTMLMIHTPHGAARGTAEDIRKYADGLDVFTSAALKSYMRHAKVPEAQISSLLDSENWLTADEAASHFSNIEVASVQVKPQALLSPEQIGETEICGARTFKDSLCIF